MVARIRIIYRAPINTPAIGIVKQFITIHALADRV